MEQRGSMKQTFTLKILILVFSISTCWLNAEQVLILGSGPAGLTAAIYTARAGLTTLVLEGEEPGGQIALSYAVDNFPGFPEGINGYELGVNMREQAKRFGATIQQGTVIEVDLSQRPFTVTLKGGQVITAESLIVASGASAKWLNIPSERALIGKGVSSCAICDGAFYKNKEVIVVGGGDTAIEDALFLANYASKITVIHRRDMLKASKHLQDRAFANPKIRFVWDSEVQEIASDPTQTEVTGVVVKQVHTGEKQFFPCDGVFVAIGHTPNSEIFRGQIALNDAGYIHTKPSCTDTDVAGVFAAGDVADPRYRQAVTAAGSGCMAGMDAYEFIQQQSNNREYICQ